MPLALCADSILLAVPESRCTCYPSYLARGRPVVPFWRGPSPRASQNLGDRRQRRDRVCLSPRCLDQSSQSEMEVFLDGEHLLMITKGWGAEEGAMRFQLLYARRDPSYTVRYTSRAVYVCDWTYHHAVPVLSWIAVSSALLDDLFFFLSVTPQARCILFCVCPPCNPVQKQNYHG